MPTFGQTQQHARADASEQYDVFISYNRNDCVSARKFASELKKRGLRVWMDEMNLVPGDQWQKEIARALAHTNAVAVLIGPSGLGGWQELELQMALAKQPERGVRMLPVPLPGAPSSCTRPDLLAPFQHCDLRASDCTAQLDALAEASIHERELRVQHSSVETTEAHPDWLVELFRSSGKTLLRRELAQRQHVPQPGDENEYKRMRS